MTILVERIMRVVRHTVFPCVAVLTLGCVGERGLPVGVAPSGTVGTVVIAPRNVILAVGGTQQLSMSAVTLTGAPIVDADSVQYVLATLSDSVRARVTGNGLLTGVSPTGIPIAVNVLVFSHNAVQGDQALVQVTPSAIAGLMLSIQPALGDSAKLASGTVKTIVPLLSNPATGISVANPQIQYDVRKADENRLGVFLGTVSMANNAFAVRIGRSFSGASVGRNQILPYVGEGTAWVYANVSAYGTLLRDSVLYTLTYPYALSISASKANLGVGMLIGSSLGILMPGATWTETLASGATVTFASSISATDPLTIAYSFDTPAAATAAVPPSVPGGASGNITALTGGQSSKRRFLTSGTYHWTMTAAGGPAPWPGQTTVGTIVIK